ncbi:MAG: adenosylcobinamide-GDP ribazoletransferase [Gemmatimonadota bacterium]
MTAPLKGFMLALGFLSVFPVGRAEPANEGGGGTPFFPLVGALLGAVIALAFFLPLAPIPRAAVMVFLSVAVTGGLHEDGWADVADAVFPEVDREWRLRILKDPRVGAHGVTATVLLLLARFAAYTAVSPVAVIAAGMFARWTMVLSLRCAPPLFAKGLAARLSRGTRPWAASLVGLVVLGILYGVGGDPRILASPLFAAGVVWLGGWLLVRRFGGLNGDGHGALGLLAELGFLYAFLLLGDA